MQDSNTQFKDFQGSASLDFHGIHPTLDTLAIEIGLDTQKYRPVGLGLQIWNNLKENISLSIFVVNNENEDPAEDSYYVTRVNCEIEPQKLFSYFKELTITLTKCNEGKMDYIIIDSKHISEMHG